jgi:uncharacterized membrane protein YpjA
LELVLSYCNMQLLCNDNLKGTIYGNLYYLNRKKIKNDIRKMRPYALRIR